ncbi:MAG TPA: MOSC domain-containing protein [Burkholderiales bacterium]|nr:MOSC domain-containing protein [Burkholderiales bacterium]
MKPNPASPLRRLMDTFPHAGRLVWIGVRPKKREAPLGVAEVEAIAGRGLKGDHRALGRAGSERQVTLIQAEHLDAVAHLLARDGIDPALTRRNLVVAGINVLALKDQVFTIGDVVIEGIGPCEPCSRMEANLGEGGYDAMRGHGGITARIVTGGVIRVGDAVRCPPD